MRVILFDLGDTLEQETPEHQDVLLPGALEMLAAIQSLRDPDNAAPALALLSDFDDQESTGSIAGTPAQVKVFRKQYVKLVEDLKLLSFFEPRQQRITLSIEAGVRKPDQKIFRAAIDKISPGLQFHHTLFVTENAIHIAAASKLGMMAIQFNGSGQGAGSVSSLIELVPLVEGWLKVSPSDKKSANAKGHVSGIAQKSKS